MFFIESLSLEEKLFNGDVVEIGTMPYIVSLKYISFHYCIGFLISSKHVLTAANCIEDLIISTNPNFRNYYASVGSLDILEDKYKHFFHKVEAHENYELKGNKPTHNIAVITVNHFFLFIHRKKFLVDLTTFRLLSEVCRGDEAIF